MVIFLFSSWLPPLCFIFIFVCLLFMRYGPMFLGGSWDEERFDAYEAVLFQ